MENQNIEQLLIYCQENNISVTSTLSKNLILADIHRSLGEKFPLVPEDPNAYRVALEVGVDPHLPAEVYAKYCKEINSPYEYLQPPGLTAVVFPIYQGTAVINESLFYTTLPRNLFSMTNRNFVQVISRSMETPAYFNDTIFEYIFTHINTFTRSENENETIFNARCVLHFQTLSCLISIAELMPNKSEYFKTIPGCINHILNCLSPELAKQVITICTGQHLTGDREPIFLQAQQDKYFASDIPSPLLFPYCFAIPPNKFEQEWYKEKSVYDILSPYKRAGDKYGLNIYNKKEMVASNFIDEAYQLQPMMNYNGTLKPIPNPTLFDFRKAMIEIVKIKHKAIRYMSDEKIKQYMGYNGIPFLTRSMLIINIRRLTMDWNPNIENSGKHLDLVSTTAFCSNKTDVYFTPLSEVLEEDLLILYGTYLTPGICFTINELMASFGYNGMFPEIPIFKIPSEPNHIFSSEQITELIRIGELYNVINPKYYDFFESLKNINEILSNESVGELRRSPERSKFIKIFELLFYAGMAKKGWKGWEIVDGKEVPYPFPMTIEDARKATINEYLYLMSRFLVDAKALVDSLTPVDRNLFNSLISYKYEGNRMIPQSQLLGTIFDNILKGEEGGVNSCTALASNLFIVSSYFYLTGLGITIPNFDINKMENAVVHHD